MPRLANNDRIAFLMRLIRRSECLAVLDQSALFADLRLGNMNAFQVTHHGHAGQPQGVVFIGLAFDVLPLPGFFVGAADERLDLQFTANIIDPAAGSTGFHHHELGTPGFLAGQ